MNDSAYQTLVEVSVRRPLTPAEEAQLEALFRSQPGLARAWEEDARLNEALRRLLDPPLASNFSAQVLRAVEHARSREHRRASPAWGQWLGSLGHAWQLGAATLGLALVFLGQHQYRAHTRAALARSVAAVSTIAGTPSVETLLDLDSIYRLPPAPLADEETLLANLQSLATNP